MINMDKKIYHIAAELAMFGGLFFYVNRKNKSISYQLEELQQEIDEMNETIESKAHGSFMEHSKLYQLQEKNKDELHQIQEIKTQLKEDVQQLQLARDQHHIEQEKIKKD
jgi:TolA-binding protein